MKVLVINGCIRGKVSRTKKLLDVFLSSLEEQADKLDDPAAVAVEQLDLTELDLSCLMGEYFEERERLLSKGERNHPRFQYAHQFAEADRIVIAAPFWDLSIPALLKIYIENISVDGITFGCNDEGMYGLCRASQLLFFTTRGSAVGDGEMEQGARYLKALCLMYGIPGFRCICAEGIDDQSLDGKAILGQAVLEAVIAGKEFFQ